VTVAARLPSPPPKGLRLSCVRPFGKAPRPPFGLAAFCDQEDAGLCVLLDLPGSWPSSGFGDADVVAAQIPDATSLSPGQMVVVLARGAPPREWLGRLLSRRTWVGTPVRATALLSRGYVRIGAGFDAKTRADVVWGFA
jgi:hypothetical protein